MSNSGETPKNPAPAAPARRPWVDPRVQGLPRLTELTLTTSSFSVSAGEGGIGGGGSTVIP